MDRTAAFYSAPSYSYGGGAMPVFSGSRRQRGGSIFGAFRRLFIPIIKMLGKKLAKKGAQQAVGLAGDVARDAFLFKDVKQSLANNAKKRALNFGKYAVDEGLAGLQNVIGSGKRRRKSGPKSRRPSNLRKRKLSTKRRKSKPRKRRRSAKTVF